MMKANETGPQKGSKNVITETNLITATTRNLKALHIRIFLTVSANVCLMA